jgi:hypothetical protein
MLRTGTKKPFLRLRNPALLVIPLALALLLFADAFAEGEESTTEVTNSCIECHSNPTPTPATRREHTVPKSPEA